MNKELGRIVKDMVIYLLRYHGYNVRKNFDIKKGMLVKWFAGFWEDKALDGEYFLEDLVDVSKKLVDLILENYKCDTVFIGDVSCDKTYHCDYSANYYNFGMEIGDKDDKDTNKTMA